MITATPQGEENVQKGLFGGFFFCFQNSAFFPKGIREVRPRHGSGPKAEKRVVWEVFKVHLTGPGKLPTHPTSLYRWSGRFQTTFRHSETLNTRKVLAPSVRGLRGPCSSRRRTKRVHTPGRASEAKERKVPPSFSRTRELRAGGRLALRAQRLGRGAGPEARGKRSMRRAPGAPGCARRPSSVPGSRNRRLRQRPRGPGLPGLPRVPPLPSRGAPRSPRAPGCSYPGNGERLLEVLAPHEAEAPWPRALENYLLGGHGTAKASGDPRRQTRQDAAGALGSPAALRVRAPRAGSAGRAGRAGRGRLRPGGGEAARPARPPRPVAQCLAEG